MRLKKFFCVLLCAALILSAMSVHVWVDDAAPAALAAEPAATAAPVLDALAAETIRVEKETQGNMPIVRYQNIDAFVAKAKEISPETDSLTLAKYILSCTGQDFAALPDDRILETLSFQEIFVASQTAGGIQFTTMAGLQKTDEYGGHYVIACRAVWQKMPLCYLGDMLLLSQSAVYDSDYSIYGYVAERLNCCTEHKIYTDFSTSERYGRNAAITYPTIGTNPMIGGVAVEFDLVSPLGFTCSRVGQDHARAVTQVEAYVRYRAIAAKDEALVLQSVYVHRSLLAKMYYRTTPVTVKI